MTTWQAAAGPARVSGIPEVTHDQARTEGPAVAQAAVGPDGLRGRHRRRLRGRHAGLHRHDRRVVQEPLRAHAAGRRRRRRGAPGGQVRLLGPADDARRHAREGQGHARRRGRRGRRQLRRHAARQAGRADRLQRPADAAALRVNTEERFQRARLRERRPAGQRRRGRARPRHGQQVRLQGRRHGHGLGHRARQAVQGLRHRLAGRPGQPRRRAAGRDDARPRPSA